MNRWIGVILFALGCGAGLAGEPQGKNVLVVTTTVAYRHPSIPIAEKVLARLGKESGLFSVDFARVDPAEPQFAGSEGQVDLQKFHRAIKKVLEEKMSRAALSNYDAVIFANTSGELPLPDKEALLDFVASGKGFVGMHAAADTLHSFKPYGKMLGGEFLSHGSQPEVEVLNEDPESSACKHLPSRWKVVDEIYTFQNFYRYKVHGLLRLDKDPNSESHELGDFPVSWCREYGKGRVFYTSLGHREDIWEEETRPRYRRNPKAVSEAFQKHILEGIKWALGLEKTDAKPQISKP
jgi:type 1 glutamine amidotransferase